MLECLELVFEQLIALHIKMSRKNVQIPIYGGLPLHQPLDPPLQAHIAFLAAELTGYTVHHGSAVVDCVASQ